MEPRKFFIRSGTGKDAEPVLNAFKLFLQREGDLNYIQNALNNYPSALVFEGEELLGFAYCGFMAPDIIELANIALHPACRNSGLGSSLLKFLEEASESYRAIMLTNSNLYSGKRNASNFYLNNGYRLLAGTGKTNLFWKDLTFSQ